jgi:hypothetical protein
MGARRACTDAATAGTGRPIGVAFACLAALRETAYSEFLRTLRAESLAPHPNSSASLFPGSGAFMKASPTRKPCTPASRMRVTSSLA